jgi:hypothetical protein
MAVPPVAHFGLRETYDKLQIRVLDVISKC